MKWWEFSAHASKSVIKQQKKIILKGMSCNVTCRKFFMFFEKIFSKEFALVFFVRLKLLVSEFNGLQSFKLIMNE
jgi:hypothetical protein